MVGLKKGKICFFYDLIWNLNLNCIEVTVNLTRFVINLVFFFSNCVTLSSMTFQCVLIKRERVADDERVTDMCVFMKRICDNIQ